MDLSKEIENIQNYLISKKFNEALKSCEELLKIFPQNTHLNNLTGITLQQVGRFDVSANFFLKAIKIDPNNIRAKNNLANTYNFLGNFKKAEDLYIQILKIDPNNFTCLTNYARLKQHLTDFEVAIPLYEKATELDPKNIPTLMNLAIAQTSIGNINQSINLVDKVITLKPDLMSAHKFKSSITQYKKNHEHLNQMVDLSKLQNLDNEKKIDLFFALGKAFEDIENYEKAFSYYDEANKIMSKKINYNISKEETLFSNIYETFKDIDLNKTNQRLSEKKNYIYLWYAKVRNNFSRANSVFSQRCLGSWRTILFTTIDK